MILVVKTGGDGEFLYSALRAALIRDHVVILRWLEDLLTNAVTPDEVCGIGKIV